MYKPEASDPSTEDDCEEATEDLLESSVSFLRLKILPGRLSVPAKVPASEEDPATSLEVGGKRSSTSHSDELFCKSWLNSSSRRPLKRKQDTNLSAFDFEPRTQKWNHVPISRTDVGFRNHSL